MPDITRILCPIDFSDASAHAIEQAVALAGWYKARITALHVCNPLFMPVPGLPAPTDRVPDAEVQRLRDQTTACFDRAIAAGIGVDVVIAIGQPAAEILDRARREPVDLIVMGTHGASGFAHLVLGSVTERVLRRAGCAVLSVPPQARCTSTLPFKRLLCAVDFSDPSLAALQLACSIADEAGAGLTILHVLEWPWEEPPPPAFTELPPEQAAALTEYRRYVETAAMARLNALAPDAARHRLAPNPMTRHGKPYVEILRLAVEETADLIVMGVHGRSLVGLTVFGSTTNHVVRAATCPVLTFRQ